MVDKTCGKKEERKLAKKRYTNNLIDKLLIYRVEYCN